MRPGGRPWRTSSKLAFVAYRINGGVLDKKLAEKEWLCFVGGWGGVPPEAFCAEKKDFTSFRDAINDLFVDDEENGLMRNPEEEFLDRGDETCEDDDYEEEYEDGDYQKDGGFVEESESLKEDDEGDDEAGKLKSEVADLESKLRAKCVQNEVGKL